MDRPLIRVLKRDRKVMIRLAGIPEGATEGVSMTSEEAQCAANAIARLPKDNTRVSMRFGPLRISHFPNHHQPVELHFGDADWSIVVDLSRTESFTVGDMIRAAGVSNLPFDGEIDLQYVPRATAHHKVVLPESLTSLLDAGPDTLSGFEADDISADEPEASKQIPPPSGKNKRRA